MADEGEEGVVPPGGGLGEAAVEAPVRVPTMRFPRYDGRTNPAIWIRRFTRVLRAQGIPAEGRRATEIAFALLDGEAAVWSDLSFEGDVLSEWRHFAEALRSRFGIGKDGDEFVKDKLRHIAQRSEEDINQYAERYLSWCRETTPPISFGTYVREWVRGLRDARMSEMVFFEINDLDPPDFNGVRRSARKIERAWRLARDAPPKELPHEKPALRVDNGVKQMLKVLTALLQQVADKEDVSEVKEKGAARYVGTQGRRPVASSGPDARVVVGHRSAKQSGPRAMDRRDSERRCPEEVRSKERAGNQEAGDESRTAEARAAEKRRKGATGQKVRKPRTKPTLDTEWLEYAARNWSVPLHFLRGRSKREMYTQVVLGIREAFGFTPKPRKKPAVGQPVEERPPAAVEGPREEPVERQDQPPPTSRPMTRARRRQMEEEERGTEGAPMEGIEAEGAQVAAYLDEARHGRREACAAAMVGVSPPRRARVKVGTAACTRVILDPGSTFSLLDEQFARKNRLHFDVPSRTILELANGTTVKPLGRTEELAASVEGVTRLISFSVMRAKGAYDAILGRDWLRLTNTVADFGDDVYTVGGPEGPRLRPDGKELLVLPPPAPELRAEEDDEAEEVLEAEVALRKLLEEIEAMSEDATTSAGEDEEDVWMGYSALELPDVVGELQLSDSLPSSELEEVNAVLNEFSDCFAMGFAELQPTPLTQFEINVRPGAKAVRSYWQPRLSPAESEFVEAQVEELLRGGIITTFEDACRKFGKPARGELWVSPITVAPKAEGGYRFCVNYAALNDETLDDDFRLPLIDHVLDDLAGASRYTVLDAFSGYHVMEVSPLSVIKLPFRAIEGCFATCVCLLVLRTG